MCIYVCIHIYIMCTRVNICMSRAVRPFGGGAGICASVYVYMYVYIYEYM